MQKTATDNSIKIAAPTLTLPKASQYRISRLQLDRVINHLVLLALLCSVVIFGGVHLKRQQLQAPDYSAPQPDSAPVAVSEIDSPLILPGVLDNRQNGILLAAAVPHTIIPDRTVVVEEIRTYNVDYGDTIFGIALKFGLTPETLLWANPNIENNPDLLQIGQEVTILPVDGVYHQVGASDTLETIATAFKVSSDAIINYHLNNLDAENPVILPGQWLIVPGGQKPYVAKYVSSVAVNAPDGALGGTGTFIWPASGKITQEYWGGHQALDIGAWTGAPVFAADSGYIAAAQWDDTGYGRMIIIDHGNGFKTLYAHLQVMYVSVGDEVTQGQQIAEMGSTGNSTGPHLHFEALLNGVKRNPWGFLP